MLLLPQFSSVRGTKGFARKPWLRAIKLAPWRTVILRRSTLAETEPFAIYPESKNLYSSVRFRPVRERKSALESPCPSLSEILFWVPSSLLLGFRLLWGYRADSRVSLVRVSLKFTALTLQSCFLWLSGVPEADSVVRLAVSLLLWPYFLGFGLSPSVADLEKHRCYDMLLLRQFSSVLGKKRFASKPLLRAIKLAPWRTVIFRRSTLAETEPFAINPEFKNLYSSVRFRPIRERKSALESPCPPLSDILFWVPSSLLLGFRLLWG